MKDRELEAGVDNFEDESVDVSILSRGFRVGPILRNRLDPKLKRQVFPFRIAETRALFRLIALAKQVVSRPIGKERVHYEAPTPARLKPEMKKFLDWFEKESSIDLVLKAGVAHLRFVTIHPFEDCNGRIARALAGMVLARSEQSQQRFYSMFAQIRQEREEYYEILESTQKGDLDITNWPE